MLHAKSRKEQYRTQQKNTVNADIQNTLKQEVSQLGQRLKTIEELLSNRSWEENQRVFEIETNSAVTELSYALVTSNATLPGIANIVLNYAKVFTKSESGYVSSIDPQTKNNLCHTLTGMMGDSCKISDYEKGIVFPVGPDGKYPTLWGHCLNTREAFYTNSPQTHAASTGIPEKHIKLRNFLSVPAIIGDNVYGQISVANTINGYTDYELKGVKRLAAVFALAIQREMDKVKLQQEIKKRKILERNMHNGDKTFNQIDLEEANRALRALLEQRGMEQKQTEKKIIQNVNHLISPYFEKLEQTELTPQQQTYLKIIKNNLKDVISPFMTQTKSAGIYLTPQELQVASLIRSGHPSKDIAEILDIAPNSVNFHRKNLRRKFKIRNRQVNLQTYLLAFDKL